LSATPWFQCSQTHFAFPVVSCVFLHSCTSSCL
jgi:hypothetical protein